MSIVEQVQNLQCSDKAKCDMAELKAALEKYHKMVDDGVLIPRQNTLQNGYSSDINGHNIKWSNI